MFSELRKRESVGRGSHFDVSRIPGNVVKAVLVTRARSMGGNLNEKRRGSRRLQPGASVGAQNLFDDERLPKGRNVQSGGPDATGGNLGRHEPHGRAMRLGTKEYRQFVGIARGSAGEVCYQLLLAKDLNYISEDTYRELRSGYDRVLQMLSSLSQTLGDVPRSR